MYHIEFLVDGPEGENPIVCKEEINGSVTRYQSIEQATAKARKIVGARENVAIAHCEKKTRSKSNRFR